MEPETESLEDVPLLYLVGTVEVGRGEGDPPGAVIAAGRHASIDRPALEREPAGRREARQPAEPGGLELGVEAALPGQLAAAGSDNALPHR